MTINSKTLGGAGLWVICGANPDGWPNISVGGPGFCFPVGRWNGKKYKLHRFEYEGKRCKPPRRSLPNGHLLARMRTGLTSIAIGLMGAKPGLFVRSLQLQLPAP
ncbi:MAG: hypothetical protein HZB64_06575 [Rhodocyclales bacterium]|nr:hypothetical protein [Rhodocyclales bacterium]